MIKVSPGISPKALLVGLCLAFLVAAVAFDGIADWWNRRAAVEQAVRPLADKADTAQAIHEDGGKADAQRQSMDDAATRAGHEYRQQMTRSKQNDPTVADRADRPVPDSVRDAFRARREAIERSAGAGGER